MKISLNRIIQIALLLMSVINNYETVTPQKTVPQETAMPRSTTINRPTARSMNPLMICVRLEPMQAGHKRRATQAMER
jgi:hypothetical protein